MTHRRVHGIYPAVPTAFTFGGDLDCGAQREIVDDIVTRGVHGIFGSGSQGESYALSIEERLALTEAYEKIGRGAADYPHGDGNALSSGTSHTEREERIWTATMQDRMLVA